ncbi:PIG-L deacetylase family protein [Streptomyces iconiensis]|uniref:PIG-L family deacetylase n=1 Tax=Streptomyces iconiensis TaxID=1384038 RepID=A0ABT7A8W1_9ACTN|nr:PIG-L family deacetylase [Streptomyces iconiensis]MDJ1137792.1 PIG-L family deacetylase [Streptomyces iconiensis]
MATVVAFHAHPDDEVLLTGGTLACAAADGHRVVVVTATDGATGARGEAGAAGAVRLAELRDSAEALGAHRVVHLGYADSGREEPMPADPHDRPRFARVRTEEAAGELAEVLREEAADLLLGYDANGGYGHRDHVKVHQVGRLAAELTGTRLLEATLPREVIAPAFRLAGRLRAPFRTPWRTYAPEPALFTERAAITHRLDVRRAARQKRTALAAHHSQLYGAGRLAPWLRLATRLPVPLFGLVLGCEWYVEVPRTPRVPDRTGPAAPAGPAEPAAPAERAE